MLEKAFALNHSIKNISMTMLMKEKVNGDYYRKKLNSKLFTIHIMYT
jgi:hypothetical protein